MAETIAVCAIIGGVLILAGRSFYKTLTGKNEQCGCKTGPCPASTCGNQWNVPSKKSRSSDEDSLSLTLMRLRQKGRRSQ
jgi:hypothetical protein